MRCRWLFGAVLISCVCLASEARAHTPPPRDRMELTVQRPLLLLTDARYSPVGQGVSWSGDIVQVVGQVDPQRLVYVCRSDVGQCVRVERYEQCAAEPQQGVASCPAGQWYVRVSAQQEAWPGWQPPYNPRRAPQQTPTYVQPPPVDPCAGRPVQREWAGHMVAGPEFAMSGSDPRMGFVISPGFRRIVVHDPSVAQSTREPCEESPPSLDRVPYSRLIGTEFGLDLRAHTHWKLSGNPGIVASLGIVPVGRIVLGERWRVPSILGALVPEVGYQMHSRPSDPMGPTPGRNVTDWWLYLRPAGWAVGYVFARYPRASVTVDAAPVFAIPFSGQPFVMGFSAFAALEVSMW